MLTREQMRGARCILGWSAEVLAKQAGVGVATVRRIEGSEAELTKAKAETLAAIREAFTSEGIQFVQAGDVAEGVGVVLRAGGSRGPKG